jgi:hypothetical protein
MAHVEVLVQVDHRTTDGMEEPHTLQVKVDGLGSDDAWARASDAVQEFLSAERAAQRDVDRQVQAAEGPWCNEILVMGDTGYHCNLQPQHLFGHENFQSGRSWSDPTPRRDDQ